MSTTAEVPSASIGSESRLLFRGVDWDFYETVLRSLENRRVSITYDCGSLEIMSPLPEHESWSLMIHDLLKILARELRINVRSLGSTTWKRRDLDKGLEPDKCFYVQNAQRVWATDSIDLTRDPPPDLAIEIDLTSSSLNRMGIYAALGVPEVWRFDGRTLVVNLLRTGGTYQPSQTSVAFPSLPLAEFERFLRLRRTIPEVQLEIQFQEWVRSNLANT